MKKKHKPGKRKTRIAAAQLDSTRPNPVQDRYYVLAQSGPADLVLDRYTREVAQNRCESAFLNETTIFGACLKASALVIGVGPLLELTGISLPFGVLPPEKLHEKLEYLEELWSEFSDGIGLDEILRLAVMEDIYHGEVILRKIADPESEPGFRFVLIRPERLGNPYQYVADPCVYDGIRFDREDDSGRPTHYYILKEYINPINTSFEYEEIPADEIIHFFSPILPGQHRGLPPLQSALPRIAQLRQLIKASLTAATNAAKLNIVFKTDNQDILEAISRRSAIDVYPSLKCVDIEDGGIFAPPGYEPVFTDAKHPTAEFGNFKKVISADIGSTIGMGSGKINNDHSGYNYSSAKMDYRTDDVIVQIKQRRIGQMILNPIFEDWIEEISAYDWIASELLGFCGSVKKIKRKWLFPEPRSIDEEKDARADEIRLRTGTITREEIFSRDRKDACSEMTKWGEEQKKVSEILAGMGGAAPPVNTVNTGEFAEAE